MLPLPTPRERGTGQSSVWTLGVKGDPRGHRHSSRQRRSHPHRVHPLPSPRRDPLEVLRYPQQGWRVPRGSQRRCRENRLLLLLGQRAPHALHVSSHSPGQGARQQSLPLRRRRGGGPGHSPLTISKAVLGLALRRALRPVSTGARFPPRTPSGSQTPPDGMGEEPRLRTPLATHTVPTLLRLAPRSSTSAQPSETGNVASWWEA